MTDQSTFQAEPGSFRAELAASCEPHVAEKIATYGPTRLREWDEKLLAVVADDRYDNDFRELAQATHLRVQEALLDWQRADETAALILAGRTVRA